MELSGGLFGVVVVLVLVTLGVVGYLIYDYTQYKGAVADTLKKDRETDLAHDRYIIDKTNEITGTLNAGLATTTSTAAYARAGLSNVTDVFGATFRFSSNTGGVPTGAAAEGAPALGGFKLGEMPGAPVGSVALMKHTSFVSGLTARDLSPGAGAATFCGTGANAERCLRFPDAKGNTYLTGLTPEASVVLDAAETRLVGGQLSLGPNGGAEDGVVAYQADTLFVHGKNAAVGNVVTGANMLTLNDEAGLTYFGKTGTGLGAGAGAGPGPIAFAVNPQGDALFTGQIYLSSNQTPYATIGFDDATKSVRIRNTAGGAVIVQGNVVLADETGAAYGSIGRDTTTEGGGLLVSSVRNNRLTLDADVYLGSGRSLYGPVVAPAAPPPVDTSAVTAAA